MIVVVIVLNAVDNQIKIITNIIAL